MKPTELIGPALIVALIAVPSIMAYKTVQISKATACLEASAKKFEVPLQLLLAVDKVEFGGGAHGRACQRSDGEAKSLARALALARGVPERALAAFYAGESGLRAYDAKMNGPHTMATDKVIKLMQMAPSRK